MKLEPILDPSDIFCPAFKAGATLGGPQIFRGTLENDDPFEICELDNYTVAIWSPELEIIKVKKQGSRLSEIAHDYYVQTDYYDFEISEIRLKSKLELNAACRRVRKTYKGEL